MKPHLFFVTCHRYNEEEFYIDFLYKPTLLELLDRVANCIRETARVESGKVLLPTHLYELTELESLTIGMEGLDGSTDEVVEYLEEANA